MPKILFVCTANRFRSPIAAACFRKELDQRKAGGDWEVYSAGTWAVDGGSAASEAVRGAQGMGLDIAGHASQTINPQLMKTADLIVVMEKGHKEALQVEFPASASRVYLLSEATTGSSYDIPDPATSDFATSAGVVREIDELIHAGFDRMCALISKK